jgi:hypothetical protein
MPYQTEGSQSLMLGMLDYIRKFEPAVDPLDGEFPCRSFCEPARYCAAASFLAASPQWVKNRPTASRPYVSFRQVRTLSRPEHTSRSSSPSTLPLPRSRVPAARLAVAVEKDRVRLRLGVDINPDRRAIVMRLSRHYALTSITGLPAIWPGPSSPIATSRSCATGSADASA